VAGDGHASPVSQELLRTAFEEAAVGMCLAAPDGRVLEVNPALCRMLGRTADDVLAGTWQKVTHPDELQADLELAAEMLADGRQSYSLLKRYLRPDGEVLWGELSVSCVRGADRSVRTLIAQVVDVTARVEGEKRYRLLAENASDVVYVCDLEGRISWIAPTVAWVLGWPADELVGTRLADLVHPDHAAKVVAEREVLATAAASAVLGPWPVRGKDGNYIWMMGTATLLPSQDGAAREVVVGLRSVDGLMRAHREVEEREAALYATLDALMDPHVVFAPVRDAHGAIVDLRYVFANRAACAANGKTVEQMVDTTLLELSPGLADTPLFGLYVAAFEAQEPLAVDDFLYENERLGLRRRYDIRAVCVGENLSVSSRDVTERHEAAQALAESEAWLRAIVEGTREGISVLDLRSGRYSFVSPAMVAITGFTSEEMNTLGADEIADRCHPDDRHVSVAQQSLLRDGFDELGTVEYRWQVKSGEYRRLRDSRKALCDERGAPYALVGVVADVTDERAVEAALLESRKRLQATFDSMLDPHVLLQAVRDEAGAIVDFIFAEANDAACAYLRLDPTQLIGARLLDILPGQAGSGMLGMYAEAVESGRPLALDDYSYPHEILGSERHYDIRAVRIGDALSFTWRDVTERSEAAAHLVASEELLRLAREAADAGVWSWDFADGHLDWDERLCRWYEISDEARAAGLFYDTWRARVHPDDVARAEARLNAAREEGSPFDDTFRVVRSDGEVRHIHSAAVIERDAEGVPVRMVGINMDVTEQVGALAAVEASMARYRALADTAADAIVTADMEGTITGWNAGAAVMFGYSEAEALGQPVVILMPERYREAHPGAVRRVRDTDERHIVGRVVEFEALRRDGEELPIELSMAEWEVAGQRYVTTIIRDISDRRAAAEALAASEERFRTVADYTADWEWWQAPDGRLLYVSPSCERLTGYSADEFLADDELLLRITHPDDRERMTAHHGHFEGRAGARRAQSLEFRIITRDGAERWIGHNCLRILLPDGTDLGVRASNRDITDLVTATAEVRRLNAELEQRVEERTAQLVAANEELQAFSYSISHDLRAPLRAIDGFSQLIAEDYGPRMQADGRDDLQRIRAAAQKMGKLIDALLTLSRLSRGDIQLDEVDVSGMAREIVAGLRQREPERRVEVVVADGLVARADPDLLEVALTNLLNNAWKFTGERELAHIEVGEEDNSAERVFFVRDDGAGFDAAYAHKLFRPFERLHPNDVFPGTGIGLATVGRIVARMGGHCWAEGAVGEGATFYFTLAPP